MDGRPAGPSAIGVVPLCSNEPAVPTHDRVGSYDGRQLRESIAANNLSFHGKNSALVVRQKESLPAHLLHQHSDLSILKFDDLRESDTTSGPFPPTDGKPQSQKLDDPIIPTTSHEKTTAVPGLPKS